MLKMTAYLCYTGIIAQFFTQPLMAEFHTTSKIANFYSYILCANQ